MTPRSEDFVPGATTRLPLPTGVPDFRGLFTTAPPALFGVWRLVGFRTVTAPVLGFYAALPLPSRPCGSHLTGYTGCREEIPLIGSYTSPSPKHLESKRRREVSGRGWKLDRRGFSRQNCAYQVSIPPF